ERRTFGKTSVLVVSEAWAPVKTTGVRGPKSNVFASRPTAVLEHRPDNNAQSVVAPANGAKMTCANEGAGEFEQCIVEGVNFKEVFGESADDLKQKFEAGRLLVRGTMDIGPHSSSVITVEEAWLATKP